MSLEDVVITVLMMSSVIRQLRGRRLTWFSLAWPVAVVAYSGIRYLGHVANHRGDVLAVIALAALGAALGLTCGALSRVYPADDPRGTIMVRSTGAAAALWILGIGSRLVFAFYAEHGGYDRIQQAGTHLGITSFTTWSNAFILMALCEVGGRTVLLAPRLYGARRDVAG